MRYGDAIKPGGVAAFVTNLARQHGISYIRSGNDTLADVVTKLADDEVVTDAIEDLLVALKRANVIDGPTMVALLGQYLAEKLQG